MFTPEEIQVLEQLWEECGEKLGWEPEFGNLVIDCERVAVITGVEGDDICVDYYAYGAAWCDRKDLIPLFRLDQLREMLEERGYDWTLTNMGKEGYSAVSSPMGGCTMPEDIEYHSGPTPLIAVGRALMEVCVEAS